MLVNYSSSSEEENEAVVQSKKRKRPNGSKDADSQSRRVSDDNEAAAVKKESSCQGSVARLPLPAPLLDMFRDPEDQHIDDRELHGGRVRSFQHERGNWATHVYLTYEPDDVFLELLDELCVGASAHGVSLTRVEEFHISLSQTVVLRHHWIQPFVESLRTRLAPCRRFVCLADKLKVYTNNEKTRTFLGMEIAPGHRQLLELVQKVDETMEEFSLSTFYKDPSFHVSLAWCVGDVTAKLRAVCLPELQSCVDHHEDGPFQINLNCKELRCKTGNKVFFFPLQ